MAKVITVVIAFSLLFLSASLLRADEIYLKNGKSLGGSVKEQTQDYVIVAVEGGEITFRADEIDRVVIAEPAAQKPEALAAPEEKQARGAGLPAQSRSIVSSASDRFGGVLRGIDVEIFRYLNKIPWFYNWSRSETVSTFRAKHEFWFKVLVYLLVLVVLLIVSKIASGILRRFLSVFFKRFRD